MKVKKVGPGGDSWETGETAFRHPLPYYMGRSGGSKPRGPGSKAYHPSGGTQAEEGKPTTGGWRRLDGQRWFGGKGPKTKAS